MKKLSIFFIFCLCIFTPLLSSVYALEWPVNDFSLSMLFGDAYSKNGSIQVGLTLVATESVKVAEYGKKLIAIEEHKNLRRFPSALGNVIVVSHEKGLQTIYGGLESPTTINDASSRVETFSVIGAVGDSAWGGRRELTFQVIDTQEKCFINPMRHLLPFLPMEDKILPAITSPTLISEKTKKSYELETIKNLEQGNYELYTFAKDSMTDKMESFAPFSLSVLLNGKNTIDMQFYVLESNRGSLYLKNTKIESKKIYNSDGKIYLGKLSLRRGRAELVILATDISQNTTKLAYSIQVE